MDRGSVVQDLVGQMKLVDKMRDDNKTSPVACGREAFSVVVDNIVEKVAVVLGLSKGRDTLDHPGSYVCIFPGHDRHVQSGDILTRSIAKGSAPVKLLSIEICEIAPATCIVSHSPFTHWAVSDTMTDRTATKATVLVAFLSLNASILMLHDMACPYRAYCAGCLYLFAKRDMQGS